MNNPLPIDIPEWVWTKVCTNIILGNLNQIEKRVHYYRTYRMTGKAPPDAPTVGILPDDAVKIFENKNSEEIEMPDFVDVHIMSVNYCNGKSYTGKIVVDA
ncbi:hypothetical protein KAR91_74680 [Candidatus Pacearchaeota archaeon]|nr:hypothetical protein [Candidatus Pacearchaeota archaeon]